MEPSHVAFRRGIVVISGHMVRERPEELLCIFGRMVVLAVETEPFNDNMRYLAVSPDFDLWNPVEGMQPPQYAATMKRGDDGKTQFVNFTKYA